MRDILTVIAIAFVFVVGLQVIFDIRDDAERCDGAVACCL